MLDSDELVAGYSINGRTGSFAPGQPFRMLECVMNFLAGRNKKRPSGEEPIRSGSGADRTHGYGRPAAGRDAPVPRNRDPRRRVHKAHQQEYHHPHQEGSGEEKRKTKWHVIFPSNIYLHAGYKNTR